MSEKKFKALKDWVQWANTSPLATEADALMAKEVNDLISLCGTLEAEVKQGTTICPHSVPTDQHCEFCWEMKDE